jgi:predicted ArsR family transcriptional regulator
VGWVQAYTATVEAFNKVFSWKTGGRARDQNVLRKESEEAYADYEKALVDGDLDGRIAALLKLRALRDEARAKRP